MIRFLERHKSISIIFLILLTIEIFYISSLTGTSSQSVNSNQFIPYIYHFSVFFLFAFFLMSSIKGKNKIKFFYAVIVIAISLLHAILDEFHQYLIPGRSSSIFDLLVDTAGIICAIITYTYHDTMKKHKIK